MRSSGVVAVALITAVSTAPTTASAQSSGPAVGLTIGTLGVGVEGSLKVMGNFVIRLNGGGASLGHELDEDGSKFDGKVKGYNAGLIADWHPFENGFRLSGGVRYVNAEFTGSISGADVTINGNSYSPAEYGVYSISARNGNALGPYLGLGWDSAHFSRNNFSMSIDIGAIYMGDPDISLSTTGTVPGLSADLAAQQAKYSDDIAGYGRFYPVIQIGGKIKF